MEKEQIDKKQEVKKLMEEASRTLTRKTLNSKEMNALAKAGEQELGISRDSLLRIKDYVHYKGNGWVDGNPLEKDPDLAVRFPDRVSPIFIKLLNLVKDLKEIGRMDIIQEYLDELELRGIKLVIDIEEKPTNERAVEIVERLDRFQNNICMLANEIRDNYKPHAEKLGFTPKRDFDKVLELYTKKDSGIDVTDQAHKLIVENIATNNATEFVNYEVGLTVKEEEEDEN